MNVELSELESKVLADLCGHCVGIMDGWVPYPARLIAKHLNITLYATRKALKRLKELGLVESISMVLDSEECSLPYHGFTVTKKAKKTLEYKNEAWKEAAICAECFGGEIKDWLI